MLIQYLWALAGFAMAGVGGIFVLAALKAMDREIKGLMGP